ncbi:MAG TPA: hypothetical protein VMU38_10015 [Candidatus Binatia bacterium]|nr:hypothetical protein [Candidatus Binatia bacterium]
MSDAGFDPAVLHEDMLKIQKLLLIMAYDQQEGRPAEHGALLRALAPEIWPEHFGSGGRTF